MLATKRGRQTFETHERRRSEASELYSKGVVQSSVGNRAHTYISMFPTAHTVVCDTSRCTSDHGYE